MWLDVQLGALIRQDATDNFKVIPERIADQIRRVEMAEFKIDTVHIFPAGSVYNSSDIGPDTSHAAHAARLKCAIESSSAQINVIPFPCSLANRRRRQVSDFVRQSPLLCSFFSALLVLSSRHLYFLFPLAICDRLSFLHASSLTTTPLHEAKLFSTPIGSLPDVHWALLMQAV